MCRANGCYKEAFHIIVPPLLFDDCSFDTVLLLDIIEHLTENQARLIIQEAKRVARHRVIVSTPNYPDLRDGVTSITGWNPLDAHLSYISRSELRRLGFKLFGCGLRPGQRYFRGALKRLGVLGWYDSWVRSNLGGLSFSLPAIADNVVGLWTKEAAGSA
jgi:SAM-dependent methyltransferase